MMKSKFSFLDIDTQNDFIQPQGALFIPGGKLIVPNLEILKNFACEKNIQVFGSVFKYFTNPDKDKQKEKLPSHCIEGTWGQKKIKETNIDEAVFIENKPLQNVVLDLLGSGRPIFFEKQSFNVFDNPNFKYIIPQLKSAAVYGVATDYSVSELVMELLELEVDVYVITDAIVELNQNQYDVNRALDKMIFNGAHPIKTQDLLKKLE